MKHWIKLKNNQPVYMGSTVEVRPRQAIVQIPEDIQESDFPYVDVNQVPSTDENGDPILNAEGMPVLEYLVSVNLSKRTQALEAQAAKELDDDEQETRQDARMDKLRQAYHNMDVVVADPANLKRLLKNLIVTVAGMREE